MSKYARKKNLYSKKQIFVKSGFICHKKDKIASQSMNACEWQISIDITEYNIYSLRQKFCTSNKNLDFFRRKFA